ncbi:histidinol dehydrogenase [Chryseobacterium sp. Leaf180]|uniref:histidinol dehydrogenase n=1 Tax=Chryseobacterium sp. Leaf180 TaxID=1736289 RepID=UPI0006F68A2F|nr:histidinol dehydrogenase [Chryseobacterium sp. Leaf180]KQR94659.1 histidinol dehydrogenase [Chryseobacterium sp. Leaf180]
MKIYKNPSKEIYQYLIQRPTLQRENLDQIIEEIFSEVKKNGDQALIEYNRKYDGAEISQLKVSKEEIDLAEKTVPEELKIAIQQAKNNIEIFHAAQIPAIKKIETTKGVVCWRENRAIEKVGIYIPGGTAPLFSTVLMLAVPAKLAGCGEIVLCTPPDKNGKINDAILYAAKLCGVTEIFKCGGAQAIAAMTFGTESIPNVYKIFGPGNQYVVAAKDFAQKFNVAIDMPAGPSEVLVIADEQAVPSYCAADLLSQAEHGSDSQVIFIATDENVLNETFSEIKSQVEMLPRKETVVLALQNSRFILVETVNEAIDFSNSYAPEHLILAVKDAENFISKIKNAGSVFLGNFSCESAGDYASGTNHTLPTNGFAKNYSGASLDSFVKKITFQNLSAEGLKNLGKAIEIMANAEGLQAHKNAVSIRLKDLQ